MWTSIVFFLFPEILFSFLSSIIFPSLQSSFLASRIFGERFFNDKVTFLLTIFFIEILGILGLLISNIKFNRTFSRNVCTILLSLILISSLIILYAAYGMRHGIGF